MQKLADGQDTEVGFSLAWLWSRCVGVPQADGWLPAGELTPGWGGAGEPLHPVAAAVSRMDTQATILLIRLVSTVTILTREPLPGLSGDLVDEGGQPGFVEQVGGADGHVVGHVVEGGPDLGHGHPGERRPGQAVGGELDGNGVAFGVGGGRAAGLPVDHVVAALGGVGEHRVDPAADQPVADQRLERDLDRAGPPFGPLAALEPGAELAQVGAACARARACASAWAVACAWVVAVAGVGRAEQVEVVDEALLAVALLQPLVEGRAPEIGRA